MATPRNNYVAKVLRRLKRTLHGSDTSRRGIQICGLGMGDVDGRRQGSNAVVDGVDHERRCPNEDHDCSGAQGCSSSHETSSRIGSAEPAGACSSGFQIVRATETQLVAVDFRAPTEYEYENKDLDVNGLRIAQVSSATDYGMQEDALVNKKLPKELLLRIFSYLDIVSLCRSAQVCKAWGKLALDGSNWQHVDLFHFQKEIKGTVVESLARRCGGFLKQLSLLGCEKIEDGALRIFAERCNCIENLNLHNCKLITDYTCQSLGKHCKRLRQLNLECCSEITDHSLKYISDGCPYVECLNVAWCENVTDDGIAALANGCVKLRKLICKGCMDITDDALKHLSEHCHNLRVLNLYKCQNVTDLGIQYVTDGCARLEYISLSHCVAITDRSLQALSHGCQMLKDLEVAACTHLTDAGFSALAKNCHDLERMDLEECSLVTDAALSHLATGCPNLVNLSLSHCEQITDEGIRHLANGLCMQERLEEIALDNCPLVTDQSLEHLKECRTLQRIDLYDCQLITRAGIRRFKHHLPRVIVHAYFAPNTPPPNPTQPSRRYCKCCIIL